MEMTAGELRKYLGDFPDSTPIRINVQVDLDPEANTYQVGSLLEASRGFSKERVCVFLEGHVS